MSRTDHLVMPENHMEEVYSSMNPLVRFAHRNRLLAIANQLPVGKNLVVLDAGCGEGHLIEVLAKKNAAHQFKGIDITDVALAKARTRCPFANFSRMDLTKIELPDASVDVITCTEVLEHVFEYREVLTEFRRVLKPGGQLIVTFPNEVIWTMSRFLLGKNPAKVPDHVNSFSPSHMRTAAGMEKITSFGLPFRFPFFLSLGYLMMFKKVDNSFAKGS